MSNIYIKEPTTDGKILMKTSVGDIDIELWSRESPIACRNFVQLCMEGYYDNVIFHRIVPGFIVQGGDPTGTGSGGESIFGKPFKDEFHSRLRFVRRGLVAMANAGANDNSSQFFFTLGPCNDLNKKHTIFAKVSGDTIYNMIRLGEVETTEDERPVNPPFIKSTKVLANPFDDIIPRVVKSKKNKKDEKSQKKSKMKATKDFKLLSFGMEAEQDEEETNEFKPKHTSKSSHDLTNDPKLSGEAVAIQQDDGAIEEADPDVTSGVKDLTSIKDKLKSKTEKKVTSLLDDNDEEKNLKRKSKIEQMQKEAKLIAKELKASKTKEKEAKSDKDSSDSENESKEVKQSDNPMYDDYKKQRKLYKAKTSGNKAKGKDREAMTMELLKNFQSKLFEQKNKKNDDEKSSDSWLVHEFVVEEAEKRDAKDMNREVNEERYALDDPRNPLNKRRRGEDKSNKKLKRKKH